MLHCVSVVAEILLDLASVKITSSTTTGIIIRRNRRQVSVLPVMLAMSYGNVVGRVHGDFGVRTEDRARDASDLWPITVALTFAPRAPSLTTLCSPLLSSAHCLYTNTSTLHFSVVGHIGTCNCPVVSECSPYHLYYIP